MSQYREDPHRVSYWAHQNRADNALMVIGLGAVVLTVVMVAVLFVAIWIAVLT